MDRSPIAQDEGERLAALARYHALDANPEQAFDEIARLIASVCDSAVGLITFVGAEWVGFKARIGLDLEGVPRVGTFCSYAIAEPGKLMIVPDATVDPRFAGAVVTVDGRPLRFYAGMPLVTDDGFALGTLCVLDPRPRFMSSQQEDALRIGGRAVMMLLEQKRAIDVLQNLTEAQRRVEQELRAEIAQRRQVERQLSFSSSHDGLTHLPNRAEFIAQLETALSNLHASAERRFCVCFIDLDRFKQVNDTLGHSVGDALLVEVGRRLKEVTRSNDAIARLGGDEFTMLVDGVSTEGAAHAIAERIAHVLASRKLRLGEAEFSVTASVGICLVDENYRSVEEILRDADIAMYAAKETGRNRCTVFTPRLREQFTSANELVVTLRHALEQRRFQLAYQPIVGLAQRQMRLAAFEALLRLRTDAGTLQSAAQFIQTAEQTGLIVELGGWVLREATAQAGRWHLDSREPIVTTVNVSARQLSEPDFAASVKAAIAATAIDPRSLALEVTESILIADFDASVAIIDDLRAFGVKIYLDDFGTGYSSLSYLRKFSVDRLKIDRSFVSGGPGEDLADPVIVHSIISLAHKLNVEVVAEGVETESQRAALAAMGCDWAQGFLFSPAIAAPAASTMLRSWNGSDSSVSAA